MSLDFFCIQNLHIQCRGLNNADPKTSISSYIQKVHIQCRRLNNADAKTSIAFTYKTCTYNVGDLTALKPNLNWVGGRESMGLAPPNTIHSLLWSIRIFTAIAKQCHPLKKPLSDCTTLLRAFQDTHKAKETYQPGPKVGVGQHRSSNESRRAEAISFWTLWACQRRVHI